MTWRWEKARLGLDCSVVNKIKSLEGSFKANFKVVVEPTCLPLAVVSSTCLPDRAQKALGFVTLRSDAFYRFFKLLTFCPLLK